MPNIAIILLIDGSGSMFGGRREGAIVSSVILHEVLKKTGIEHMIVEHRAIYGEPVLQHNVLVDLRHNQKNNKPVCLSILRHTTLASFTHSLL